MASDDPHAAALALARSGRVGDAIVILDEALAARPGDARMLALKAGLQIEAGDAAAALATSDRALAADPACAPAHGSRADALHALDRPQEALQSYERALALQPGNVAALANRGNLLQAMQRPQDALASYDAAIALAPGLAQAHSNRARVLAELDRHAEALEAAERALALKPTLAKGWARRGDALMGLERHAEALDSYRQAAALDRSGGWLIGMATALKALGRYDEAIAALDAAEALDPGSPAAPHERSMIRLLTGDFARAWPENEVRFRMPQFNANSNGFITPEVASRLTLKPSAQELAGRNLLVVGEQGIGDQLMHASLLPDLLRDARAVTWVCDRRLHGLLANAFPSVRFLDRRDGWVDPAAFDRVVAAGSLGCAYRRSAADFPGAAYVAPRREVAEAWSARLGPRSAPLRIGISWRGGTRHTGQSRRSTSLAGLRPLLQRADCEFVSLQYGDVEAEVAQCRAELGREVRVFPAAELDDFEQLAGLVCSLDAVVSVQTALVHLTGALGRRCFVMVPARPEWRYGVSGASMPWYRSVRLFRQPPEGGWGPVVGDVAEAVAALR